MDNRVYYGQYSLKHWIDLILKRNLVLPDYQRYFVWEEKDVTTLIDTFKKKEFVPPITIGVCTNEGISQNLLLDGQQRLTSILLAYLGIFPDKATFKSKFEQLANDNDDDVDDQPDENDLDSVLDWDFKKLTDKGKSKEQITTALIPGNYKPLNIVFPPNFLSKTFLGFSYLVPHTIELEVQQKYFSSVFRNINIQGKTLLAQESRASLYFLKKDFDQFFNPQFAKGYSVKSSNTDSKADFVRFLSLLSQYAKEGGTATIARGFKSKMEGYYEQYIYSVVGQETSLLFKEFITIFPNEVYMPRFDRLQATLNVLPVPTQFPSIIDMDIYLFGLIFKIVFEDRDIDTERGNQLKVELDNKIAEFKAIEGHKRAPGALKYERGR